MAAAVKVDIPWGLFGGEIVKAVERHIALGEKKGERTTHWEAIQTLMLDSGIARSGVQIPPELVGVSAQNRSRLGVGASESQHHGREVLTDGFSFKKAADATCVESPPPPHNATAIEFNQKLEERSQGLIPPLLELKYESVGGSHTNTFCRQVKAGVRSVVPTLADENGKLNMERLTIGRPPFLDACTRGMKWFQMHWATPFVWPGLLPFVQNALNTDARTGQGEVEMMLYMHQQRAQAIESGLEPNMDIIVANARSSLPGCSPYMHTIAKYVERMDSGVGKEGCSELLAELNMFMKTFACAADGPLRSLGGEFIGKVNSLEWGASMKCPRVLNACLMTNLASSKVSDGICKLLLPNNLGVLTNKSNRAIVANTERCMEDARKLADKLGAPDAMKILHVGKLDTRCILFLCKKGKEAEGRVFESIDEISDTFVADLSASLHVSIDTRPSSAAAPPKGETVDQLKDPKHLAAKKGFVKGACVVRKLKQHGLFIIEDVTPTNVVLKLHEGETTESVEYSTLLEGWKTYARKISQEVSCDAASCSPTKSMDWAMTAIKGAIAIAVRESLEQHEGPAFAKVSVFENPTQVRARVDIAKGELKLVAASARVDKKGSILSCCIGQFAMPSGQHDLYIAPQVALPETRDGDVNAYPWVSHFWMVQQHDTLKDCNMELHWEERSIAKYVVYVPILVNKRGVKAGEVLKRPRTEGAAMPPKLKRQRT